MELPTQKKQMLGHKKTNSLPIGIWYTIAILIVISLNGLANDMICMWLACLAWTDQV